MVDMSDSHDLGRFIQAQEGEYEQALSEILAGHKQSHWMWYIFPQFDGLGFSSISKRFAIKSVAEAKAYLEHPVLGLRLVECCEALVSIKGRSAAEVFGSPDDMKLRSSVTLFDFVSPVGSVFEQVLARYFGGAKDERTLQLIGITSDSPR